MTLLRSIKPLYFFLAALPAAVLAQALHADPLVIFTLAAAGLIPLAGLIGESTEALAVVTGPKVGGLLNATLGNAAELIIAIVALRAGLLDLVKASITGSILGNLLMVMGASLLFGGLRHGRQAFSRANAATNATLLVLAVIALAVPSLFNHTLAGDALPLAATESISLGVAAVMIVIYGLGLVYALRGSGPAPLEHAGGAASEAPHWPARTALIALALATVGTVWMSEILVHEVEAVTASLGWSEFFIGLILIPLIGNVSEHLVAVQVAMKNQMDLSLEIALGSSLQIAIFVAPVLVFIAPAFGQYLTLVFNQFEVIALIAAVLVANLVAADGETNWLEGAQLLAVYVVLAVAFFFLPK